MHRRCWPLKSSRCVFLSKLALKKRTGLLAGWWRELGDRLVELAVRALEMNSWALDRAPDVAY